MANVEKLQTLVKDLAITVQGLSGKIDKIQESQDRSHSDFLVYQKANQSLTNLAFSLIASATVITIVTNVFYRK